VFSVASSLHTFENRCNDRFIREDGLYLM